MPSQDAIVERIGRRLLSDPVPEEALAGLTPDWTPAVPHATPPVPAAVLIALVRRGARLGVLYTVRAAGLRVHSGQVAFPGGKIDPGDADPAAAALREAEEEVALDPAEAAVLGYMPPYLTGTNYLITPVVASVLPRRPFVPNPQEVVELFEVPLERIAAEGAYAPHRVTRGTRTQSTWAIEHEGRSIWGATAALTRRFRDLALRDAVT